MAGQVNLQARWIGEDEIWLATSDTHPGLVVEAPTWDRLVAEVEMVLPDFLAVQGLNPAGVTYSLVKP